MLIHGKPAEWHTIGALVAARAAANGDAFAFEIVGRRLSYAELHGLTDRVAANLHALGIGKGDRVCSFMFNCAEQVLLWLGACKIGAVFTPFNAALVGADLAYTLTDAGGAVLAVDQENRPKLDALDPALRDGVTLFLTDGPADGAYRDFAELLAGDAPPPDVRVGPEDPAVIMYTGGTTGLPKGVVLPHFAWICAGYRYVECFETRPGDHHYSMLPLFHVGAMQLGILGPLVADIPATVDKWFSAKTYWQRCRETGATIIDPIGSMLMFLLERPQSPDDRDHKVRISLGAWAQMHHLRDRFQDRFGIPMVNVYSMSEGGGVLLIANRLPVTKPDSNGRGWGWAEVGIVDEDDNLLPPGAVGEIVLRPLVPYSFMLGYHNNPRRTVECWRNLWYHTGDLGEMDADGDLYFIGRQAHWLRKGGENVSAYEVENILVDYPGIREVTVVGVPAESGEDEVKAFIVEEEGKTLDPAAMIAWCDERMAAFKVPRYIEIVDAFPRSATKQDVERHKLKAMPNDKAWDAEATLGRRSARGGPRRKKT